jgi:hypothetical protein
VLDHAIVVAFPFDLIHNFTFKTSVLTPRFTLPEDFIMLKLAIVGKGGSGKTFITAAIIWWEWWRIIVIVFG